MTPRRGYDGHRSFRCGPLVPPRSINSTGDAAALPPAASRVADQSMGEGINCDARQVIHQ